MDRRVVAVALLAAFLTGLAFATFSETRIFLPALLRGMVVTFQVSAGAFVIYIASSVLAGIARATGGRFVRAAAAVYVEVFRGTSLLVQLFWLFFVLPEFGVVLSPMVAGILGIGLNFGAYGAEVVRGSVSSVHRGQWEAGTALNIPRRHRIFRVILPQAMVSSIPSLGNLAIEMIKATSVVSAVTLVDITFASVQQNQLYYRTVEIFMITLLLYYIFSQIVRFCVSMLESRAMRHLRPGTA